MKIPPGLYRQLYDTFQCQICRNSPPVIFARCCKRILGCQDCVDLWYRGEEGFGRKCPLCRDERVYAKTTTLKGLDDVLLSVAPLLGEQGQDAGDEQQD